MSTAPWEAPMYNLLALLIVTAVASWCASKVHYDRQKAEEEYRKFWQLAIIIFTIIAVLTTPYFCETMDTISGLNGHLFGLKRQA